ncbi:hypothetical protein DPMN_161780 [Dreissena polymorpha]|uniref:Uncharacterized protein n=1 Tax=Dreissena polymorpha TaxID=45954 RepID=A0A9D4IRE6_DREPO|nr:hypothetical protein DPMN_161780 [Dreissena polymorpha]
MEIPDQKIPVYRVKKESGKGPVKTLHSNLILPLHSIPYEDTYPETTKPPIPKQKRPTPEVDTTKEINFPSESESDRGSETSEASPRYIIPHRRRPLPQPCVNFS